MSPDGLRAPARLHAQQTAFAAHLRDPAAAAAPGGIEERRLQIYRDLFYNNIDSLLAGNFPVIRALRGDDAWHALVRDFYREHRSHTPLFPEIGRELLRYLEARQQRAAGDPPFLLELAHYEWVELALSLDDADLAALDADRDGSLLDGVPLPSPLAWPLAYRWPVHRIAAAYQPDAPPEHPTFLLVLRDRGDQVRFKQIDALTYTLLQALHENLQRDADARDSGRSVLQRLAQQLGNHDVQQFVTDGAALLQQLHARDAILGTTRA